MTKEQQNTHTELHDQIKDDLIGAYRTFKQVLKDTARQRVKSRRGKLESKDYEYLAMAYLDFSVWCENWVKDSAYIEKLVKKT